MNTVPEEIIKTIIEHIPDKKIFPLHFVSKKMNEYTEKRIKMTFDFYNNFINGAVKRPELFEWAYELNCPINSKTCSLAAKYKNISILKQIKNSVDSLTFAYAARNGDVEMMTWLECIGCSFDETVYEMAAEYSEISTLKWLKRYERRHISNRSGKYGAVCASAAKNSNLDVLKYLRKKNYEWNADTCANAASKGNFETLRWSVKNGCEWDAKTCLAAEGNGS